MTPEFTNKLKTVYLSQVFLWIAKGASTFYQNVRLLSNHLNLLLESKSYLKPKIVLALFCIEKYRNADDNEDC